MSNPHFAALEVEGTKQRGRPGEEVVSDVV